MKFTDWFNLDDHDLFNFPEEAMQATWKAAIDAAVKAINDCEPVEPNSLRIRKHEAVGALLALKVIS